MNLHITKPLELLVRGVFIIFYLMNTIEPHLIERLELELDDMFIIVFIVLYIILLLLFI
jgi:hypothetical protein